MDGLTLTKAVGIIKNRYEGAQITRVNVTEDSVIVGIFAGDGVSVCVRVTGGTPALYTSKEIAGVKDVMLDRLSGGKITEIGCRRYDRLFYMDIAKRRPSGKVETNRLVFELIGKMANAALINENGHIIWLFAKNNADADRDFSVGSKYAQPKLNKQQTLDKYTGQDFNDLLGFYPVTVQHAAKYMENNYSFSETATLIRESLDDESFYIDDKNRIIPFKPLAEAKEVTLEDLRLYIGQKQTVKRDHDIRIRLTAFFEKQAEKYLKLKDKLKDELTVAEKYPEIRRKADLFKANLHLLHGGRGTVTLTEYTEDGMNTVEFNIPELFDPNHEVKKLYKKAEKLERSVPQLISRIEEIDNMVDSALEQIYYIEISAADDELRELALEMKKSEPKKKQQIKEKQFTRIEIGGGTAYIGRNAVSNHRLVFQFAQPSDWWFHAQKIPSAHLIFRKSGQMTPEETEQCAAIVAGLSKSAGNLRVVIDYTQKKNVKKPKNTPPGFVIYHRFRSVTVKPVAIDENNHS